VLHLAQRLSSPWAARRWGDCEALIEMAVYDDLAVVRERVNAFGAAVLSRTIKRIGNSIVCNWPGDSITSKSLRHAALPISRIGRDMVVSWPRG